MLYQLSYASGFFVTVKPANLAVSCILALPGTVTLRAGDGTRTRDIKLGRLALYQLSYSRNDTIRLPRPATHKKTRPYIHGGGRIRTFVGVSRQIYSLLPLAARAPHRFLFLAQLLSIVGRADGENRTPNLLITNQLLCQLSYVSNKQRFFIASLVE